MKLSKKLKDLKGEELKKYVKNYVSVGFSHKKMFKTSSWKKAVEIMNIGKELSIVLDKDFGRGKGKYTTPNNISIKEVETSIFSYLSNLK